MLADKAAINSNLDDQNRVQGQEIIQLKRIVAEMQVARQALQKEHQFVIENMDKDHV